MSELEIVQWAAPAAQALVGAMMGDLWGSVRDRFTGILSRRSEGASDVAEELEESRQRLLGAEGGEETRNEVMAEWRSRFRRALTQNPMLLDEIRTMLAEFEGDKPAEQRYHVEQHVRSSGGIVFNLGSGTQHNSVPGA
ncbi:hypothetical protein R6L23_14140 [Streptomyces sp. SR27]|uniref:hypothetical protein n=1 Tax=Streptomyces sp. SR27 TaxID=3076630 RepID=UPI00295B08E9|nr:hypothetical protein [Streptomyces sp. SR27]MDV9189335.1 hypothetical protein [Streptomyces sp. SR27]